MENVRAIFPYVCSLFLLSFSTTCDGEVFTDFGCNENGNETRELAQNICIYFDFQIAKIYEHAHAEDIAHSVLERHHPHVSFYTIWTHYQDQQSRTNYLRKHVHGLLFFPLIGQGPNRRRLTQKHCTTWQITWWTKERSQSFISKFSSLTDCTLIHWPSQQDLFLSG